MAEKFKKVMAMVLSLALLATFCAVPMTASAEDTNLKFADKKFKILIFADTQDQYPVYASLLNRMRLAIEKEKPDLVVFTGDQTEINTKEVEVDFRRTIERILSPVVEAGIPYAFTFGNHDPQSAHEGQITSKDAMYKVYKTIGNCLTTDLYVDSGETDESLNISGTGTCKIPIYSSDGSKVAFNLWMVDSGSYQDPLDTSSGYGSVQDDQLAWMKANNDAGINSFVFQHIPMPQIYELLKEDPNGGTTYNGKTYALELNENATGEINEFPAPCYANKSNEFAALKEMGNVLCVFTGHDHRNDFTGTYDGITMTNVPGMTYFNYGDEAMRGYGVIELNEDDLSTYDYHTVKFSELDAEAGITTEVKYDDYDIIEYTDLKDENGNKLADSYTIKGGHTFTYDATSPSYSAVLKYRWTAGSKPGYQFSFDLGANGNISHPFGVWIKNTEQVAPNGSWELKPNESEYAVKMDKPIETGKTYDIELGRLLVLSGSPQHVGQYYVYLKVNGVLIQEGYSNTADGNYVSGGADCHVSNVIRFGGWGNGGDDVISASPFVEIYEDYDDIGYTDLLRNGNPVNQSGRTITGDYDFTYNLTSPTSSAKFSFCWTAGSDQKIKVYLGWVGDGYNKFAYRTKEQKWIDLSGKNSDKPVNSAIAEGTKVNIEVGRLKVKNGANKGKYYSYFKADGVLIFESYVSAEDAAPYLNNTIRLSASNGVENGIGPEPEVLSDYEVIEYEDLYYNGDPVNVNGATIKGTKDYTYYATSPTFSTAFKFRWTAGSDQKIQVYLGNAGNYFAYRIKEQKWFDLSTSESVAVTSAIAEGDKVDIEVGRVLVAKGINKGKYYSYLKANDELIFDDYVSAADAAAYLNNKIRLIVSSDVENKIGSVNEQEPEETVKEEYAPYDVIGYNDLLNYDTLKPLAEEGMQLTKTDYAFKYNESAEAATTHSVILKLRWTMEDYEYFQIHLGSYGGKNNFAYRMKNDGYWQDRALDTHVANSNRPAEGDYYDFEVARLMVTNGKYAGKYYTYFKVDGETIFEKYVSAYDENTTKYLNNIVYLGFANDHTCFISSTSEPEIEEPEVPDEPEVETYDVPDVITYNDLRDGNGNPLGAEHTLSGGFDLTYDAKSPSHSAVFKFRFIAGSKAGVQVSFDQGEGSNIANPFGLWIKRTDQTAPNGSWHLKPHDPNLEVPMSTPLVKGKAYDIELGRKLVLTGENKGLYYVYLNVNGELIQKGYSAVDENGYYTSGNKTDCQLSNIIRFGCWGNGAEDKMTATPEPETFEPYDELTFDDLYEGSTSMLGKEMDGSHNYTYNATSDSYSMVLKYRWVAGGSEMKFTTFLDDWKYPFCFAAKTPNQSGFGATAGENGSWHLVPSNDSFIKHMDEPIVAGKAYDIEIGRKKVATGINKGQYYVYAKVNGEMIKDYYYDGVVDGAYSGVKLSNKIIISSPAGNKFSAIPIPETFEAYDELTFDDLWIGEASMSGREMDGRHDYTYNATSPTYSMKLKYRWIAGETPKFSLYLDDWKYPFCYAVKTPNQTGFGATAGPNGAWHLVPSNDSMIVNMDEPIVIGQAYDIEIGRLKVASGKNAGKYYVYFMVDGEIVQSYYYDGVVDGVYNGVALSNKIIVDASAGNKFTAVPFVEEYEDFDEIEFEDLKENGASLEGQTLISGHKVFTYNKTSPTGSVVFKYNWKVGSVAKFQLSFDKYGENTMSYMFGAQLEPKEGYPNGNMWLRPSFGPEVNLPSALAANSSHNVEFARLKVKNGPNKGKYYVYIKIDDVIIAEDYVGADVVDADGNYLSNSGKAYALSNEILFTFWGSEGNIISAYKEKQDAIEPEGTKGDFDGDGVINATDVTSLTKILLGVAESIEGMADFNGDGKEDIRDLVAMKNYLAPANSYEKTGSLTLGMQEHLLSDATKTATYIADATATMGAKAYRLSKPIHTLYYANSDRTVTVKTDAMNEFKAMVAELKAKGITEILYVTDSFILPAGYSDPTKNHNITVPDPKDDTENYVAWLQVNAAAFKALAQEVPEIKFFEPFNEINTKGTRLEKYGIGWEATDEQKAAHKFSVQEKAAIMADLCWYISDAVKSVDSANQVTSPSIVVGSNSTIEKDFIDEFYKAIESGKHPINKAITDKRVDNYFTIVNLHAYPDYTEDDSWLTDNFKSNAEKEVNEWAGYINDAYTVVKNHNDGNSRVWLTETGMSSYHPDGAYRDDQNVADIIGMALEKLDNDLTFIDTVIFYKIANISANNGASPSETNFGLFYSGDDVYESDRYYAKPIALTIYSYFHNGEDGTAVLDALANRYQA